MWFDRDDPADITLMTSTPRSPDEFEQMFAEWDTPESKLKLEQEDRFLREVIYAGLTDLNTGFDSPLIGHFSPADFLTVIDRCESLDVRVIVIEVFTTDVEPPWKVQILWIEISPQGRRVRLGSPIGLEVHGEVRHHYLCDLRYARCDSRVKLTGRY
jgi:hypothetical protein